MIAILGRFSLWLALALAVYGAFVSILGARRRRPSFIESGQGAVVSVFGLSTFAVLLMEAGLVGHDFSLEYVARNASLETPLFYTIIALWGALEGSILLWIWLLALMTVLTVWIERKRQPEVIPYVTTVLLCILAFFLFLAVIPASPFTTISPAPPDGRGPNPLLQNHPLMAVHPPGLYAGYVGWAIPYAFGMAALMTGRLGETWIRTVRRWSLAAWGFLTIGIIVGGRWSYEVLGWGGYWAWDPVENASLLPWLTGTAFLHTIMIQERRKMLKFWNVALVIITFALTIFGTFLTRSGILSSVHAFSDSAVGPLFLAFIGLILLASFSLLVYRSDKLQAESEIDSLVSRESAFLVNNLLLLGFAFSVLLGTLFPLLSEAVRGVKVSVGEPFFNTVNVPIGLSLIFLMAIGPLIAWRHASLESLRRTFAGPVYLTLVGTGICWLFGVRGLYPLLAFALSLFTAVTVCQEFVRGVRARRRNTGEGYLTALSRLTSRGRRRYGGLIVHLGMAFLVIGITASSVFKLEQEVTLKPGESLQLGRYQVRFDDLSAWQEPHRFVVQGNFTIFNANQKIAEMRPAKRFYPAEQQPIGTVDVRSTMREDLYLVLSSFTQDGTSATVKALVRPLVMWIWVGGWVMVLGSLIAIWPDRRRAVATEAAGEYAVWQPGRS
ncbi:cytochrome c-type biogenesis protein cycK [Candidatus Methylomirabilis lanthanidiphila]|uniref:Cytochrome c-type biogenesis protein cycK n=1 Tax=Candidatus Methylomirabilis lanthanidiphila TaxID=2211376 RepID=A0A564ZLY4_9BACT|nr:heme lyase CcmF/NrfE family subunit [Candidatus Methylomirabilis lanthanidiphila]VUZ86106.1 cytochrome c-type biogenesis protein cycK [Candidatus Methylomirabilis lanthanidiphila]